MNEQTKQIGHEEQTHSQSYQEDNMDNATMNAHPTEEAAQAESQARLQPMIAKSRGDCLLIAREITNLLAGHNCTIKEARQVLIMTYQTMYQTSIVSKTKPLDIKAL